MTQLSKAFKSIKVNKILHNKVAGKYKSLHDEIFNACEQRRISNTVKLIISYFSSSKDFSQLSALDYGCGTGNITNHLLREGFAVTSADISYKFLDIINRAHGTNPLCSTLLLSGYPSNDLKDFSLDLICLYSVLHHMPDYISDLKSLVKSLKPNGLIYIDHEASERYWNRCHFYRDLQSRTKCKRLLAKFPKIFDLRYISFMFIKLFYPRFQPEGDIHVWPDDHIEWTLIDNLMSKLGLELVYCSDYLHYKPFYSKQIYDHFASITNDMRLSIYRKN